MRSLLQVVPTLEAEYPAIRTWRKTDDGGPANLPTSVIYMDLPVGLPLPQPSYGAGLEQSCSERHQPQSAWQYTG